MDQRMNRLDLLPIYLELTEISGSSSTMGSTGPMGTTGGHHHLGRDAAIGAGGVGLAEHEHRKHERERETAAGTNTGMGYGANDPVTSMLGANTEGERSA